MAFELLLLLRLFGKDQRQRPKLLVHHPSSPTTTTNRATADTMKVFALLSLYVTVSMAVAVPWGWPLEEGCCRLWSPLLRKCNQWEAGCNRAEKGPCCVSTWFIVRRCGFSWANGVSRTRTITTVVREVCEACQRGVRHWSCRDML